MLDPPYPHFRLPIFFVSLRHDRQKKTRQTKLIYRAVIQLSFGTGI